MTTRNSGQIKFKSYKDWEETTPYTDTSMNPDGNLPMDNKRLNPKMAYSNSFVIESTGREIMEIDGFEYNYEMEQSDINDDNRE